MTNQERTKILEMLVSGTLTIEQADQLLDRLGAQSQASAEKRPDQSKNASGFTTFDIGGEFENQAGFERECTVSFASSLVVVSRLDGRGALRL